MRLLRLLQKRRRITSRAERIEQLREMGYELRQGGNLKSGKPLLMGYVVVAPDGEIIDNDGMGYASSRDALFAARAHRDALRGTTNPDSGNDAD